MKKLYFLTILLLTLCVTSLSAQIYYVKTDGSDFSNGNSWASAFKSIQKALTVAQNGSAIFVAAGTYTPDYGWGVTLLDRGASFVLKNGVSMYGGFDPQDPNTSLEHRTMLSVLSGDLVGNDGLGGPDMDDNSIHVIYAEGIGDTTVLDGFSISGGNANGGGIASQGGGMFILTSALQVTNCDFLFNRATNGGGIYCEVSFPKITDCYFFKNNATNGGGIHNFDSASQIANCSFSFNSASNGGGIYYGNSSTPVVTSCNFSENSATDYGGGIYNVASSATKIINSRFLSNTALYGGGINNWTDSTMSLINCTLSRNSANTGAAIYQYGVASFANCILWDNPVVNSGYLIHPNSTFTTSLIEGYNEGNGNINADPMFVDAVNGNLRLLACSPAIDTGTNASMPNVVDKDLDRNIRIKNTTIDMGAYEFSGQLYTYYADTDGDGYGGSSFIEIYCTTPPNGYVDNSSDCNDGDASINPGAYDPECSNGIDENCDGIDGEGTCVECQYVPLYRDADGDGYGYGDPDPNTPICDIGPINGLVANNLDCDDNDADVHPGATEKCGNGIDDDCDGEIDEEGCAQCGEFTDLATTNISSNSATFNWVAAVDPDAWQVQYKATTPGSKWVDVTGIQTSVRSVTVTGLNANQNYMWHLRTVCGKIKAKYSNSVPFQTNDGSYARTSISAKSVANETNSEGVLRLYPNPNTGTFVVSMLSPEVKNSEVTISIMDLMGRTITTSHSFVSDNLLQKSMDMPNSINNGLYIVKVSFNGKVFNSSLLYNK